MNTKELLATSLDRLKDEGFIPYGAVKLGKRPKGLLLHEAIRDVIGMKPDDSVYMYWDWAHLHKSLNALWLDLDDAASRMSGRRTSSIAMTFDESTSIETIENLFNEVQLNHTAQVAFEAVLRRPAKSESAVRFVGKLMGALLATIGILEESRSSGYGDLFSSLSDRARSDEELLVYLDAMCDEIDSSRNFSAPKSVVILRALGNAFEKLNEQREEDDLPQLSLGEFFVETEESANWAGLSDHVVLRRLLVICPETADAPLKAIDKFLND